MDNEVKRLTPRETLKFQSFRETLKYLESLRMRSIIIEISSGNLMFRKESRGKWRVSQGNRSKLISSRMFAVFILVQNDLTFRQFTQ